MKRKKTRSISFREKKKTLPGEASALPFSFPMKFKYHTSVLKFTQDPQKQKFPPLKRFQTASHIFLR
jgi:hypothetical protein